MSKTIIWGLIFCLVLVVLAVIGSAFIETSQEETVVESSSESSSESVQSESKKPEKRTKEEITAQATSIYDKNFSDINRENVSVLYLEDSKTVIVTEDVTKVESTVPDVVILGISKFIEMGDDVFEIPEVDSLIYSYDLTYTNARGQKEDGSPMNLFISREKWAEYNWDNLAFKPILDTLIKDKIMILDKSWDAKIKRDGFADIYIPMPE